MANLRHFALVLGLLAVMNTAGSADIDELELNMYVYTNTVAGVEFYAKMAKEAAGMECWATNYQKWKIVSMAHCKAVVGIKWISIDRAHGDHRINLAESISLGQFRQELVRHGGNLATMPCCFAVVPQVCTQHTCRILSFTAQYMQHSSPHPTHLTTYNYSIPPQETTYTGQASDWICRNHVVFSADGLKLHKSIMSYKTFDVPAFLMLPDDHDDVGNGVILSVADVFNV
jgi:hypothetical protein